MGQNSALCGLSQIKRSAKKNNNYIIYIEESLSFSDCVSPTEILAGLCLSCWLNQVNKTVVKRRVPRISKTWYSGYDKKSIIMHPNKHFVIIW